MTLSARETIIWHWAYYFGKKYDAAVSLDLMIKLAKILKVPIEDIEKISNDIIDMANGMKPFSETMEINY